MEEQRKRLKNQQSKMKILYLLFSIFILINVTFGQNIEISLNDKYATKEPICFNVKTVDTVNYFLYVHLEKLHSGNWIEYSSDVFSKPFKPLGLTLILNKEQPLNLKFFIQDPEWIDSPEFSMKKNQSIKRKAKKGVFRLKIFYSVKEGTCDNFLYSKNFRIE